MSRHSCSGSKRGRRPLALALLCAGIAGLAGASDLWAERISDVRNTVHNFSVTGPGAVRAVSEDEVCVFCHTPHGAEPGVSQFPTSVGWVGSAIEMTRSRASSAT